MSREQAAEDKVLQTAIENLTNLLQKKRKAMLDASLAQDQLDITTAFEGDRVGYTSKTEDVPSRLPNTRGFEWIP